MKKPEELTRIRPLPESATQEQKQARLLLIEIKESLQMNTSNDASAIRIISKLVSDRKIQSTYESIGDSLINRYVDKRFPYTGDGLRNDKLNTLLKSNWYLNQVYDRLKLPLPPHKFTDEKMYRFEKRRASLFEWILGLMFMLQQGNIPKYTKPVNDWINMRLTFWFSDLVTDQKELDITWYKFMEHQSQKRAMRRESKNKN